MSLTKHITNERGFTLLDLSIWLIVIGLVGSAFLMQYRSYIAGKAYADTTTTIAAVRRAIDTYYITYGRYPCPADLTRSPQDDDYGVELCDNSESYMSGGVPFRDLHLAERFALDAWKRKISYTVTTAMTDASTFTGAVGALTVRAIQIDSDGVLQFGNIEDMSGSAHYVLVSSGVNGLGAYNEAGSLYGACPAEGTTPREHMNCDGDDVFFHPSIRGGPSGRSLSRGEYYQDDVVDASLSVPTRIWMETTSDGNLVSNNLNIGIGTAFPEAAVDVTGNVLTEGGQIHVVRVCMEDSEECFDPELIAGNRLNCRDTEHAAVQYAGLGGIRNNDKVCAVLPPVGASGHCPLNQYVVGINAGGNVICRP